MIGFENFGSAIENIIRNKNSKDDKKTTIKPSLDKYLQILLLISSIILIGYK
jgi:hypothetical protein